MCGITGIAGYKGDPIKDIDAMNERIIRRGPDAGGHFVDEKRNVVLGHRRLSIIDLSETGAQPMHSHDGRYVIAYNGEIYNAPALRDEITKKDPAIKWNGTSDTEVLLEAISEYGLIETLKKCRGMWGISLYDRQTGDIMLTRDRMGEKPLYYGMVHGQFVWASDIRSITALEGFDNEINPDVLPIYLRHGYIPAPYTIYKGIYKLIPGTVLTVSAPYTMPDEPIGYPDIYTGKAGFKIEPYYDISKTAMYGQSHLFDGSEEEAADELERRLKNTLKGQMLSDVSLGAFLSGGIDSTTVVSLMQQISERPIKTFTIGFEEEEYNEAAFAAKTAEHLGTEHTQMYVGYKDVISLLPELNVAFGEPFADSSQLPTMLVSKMTKQHVTVALSGDAGDEFFCGYNTYKDAKAGLKTMQNKLGFLKGDLRCSAGRLTDRIDRITRSAENDFAKKMHVLNQVLNTDTYEQYYRAMGDDGRVYALMAGASSGKESTTSGTDMGVISTANDIYKDGLLSDPESNLMLMDMQQYLPDDILVKVDRAGMHYSLETRIPLLDADIMEFAWSLPLSYKMSAGVTKRPLRNVLYRYVPKEMMDRPKKGFSVPVSKWLRDGEMHAWAEDILRTGRSSADEYINMDFFDRIWRQYLNGGEYSSLIWYVIMFCQWIVGE